ncbi:MAG: class I SAM-dependent DNA methyltransferase [Aestuariivirgaceae bacterium]
MARRPAERRVDEARALGSTDETRALYRDWAAGYDRDIAGELEFTSGRDIAELMAQHVGDRSSSIIDLGCGTGLVGAELKRIGFAQLVGLDLSPEMLKVARSKAIYRELIEADLLQPLEIGDATYDAAISAGTFTSGHVDAGRLGEILRILKPGGVLACVIASSFWQAGGFADELARLEADGRMTLAHHSVRPISNAIAGDGRFCVMVLNERAGSNS